MDKKEKYSQLLKDPRWQKRRLEIMQRDNFTCQICGHSDIPLHVHHVFYKDNIKPWEYEDKALITLCEDCHDAEHESYINIYEKIKRLREIGVLMIEIEAILDTIDICIHGFKRPDSILKMLGNNLQHGLEHGEKQDWWGLDYPDDLCERILEWRKKWM